MRKHTLEKLFGPEWREKLDQIRWEAQHSVSEKSKRTNTRPAGKNYGNGSSRS